MSSTFSIQFAEQTSARPAGASTCLGRVVLGEFTEQFETVLGFWGREHYEAQWRTAIGRIVGGTRKDALITSLSSRDATPFVFWWPMYLEHGDVVFHNHLLLPDQLTDGFNLERYELAVPERATVSADGEAISEWVVPVDSLRAFLSRR